MMRILAILFFAFHLIGCGENKNAKPINNDLIQLENEWMQAMMKRDRPRLEELLAPEFTVTGMKYIDSAAVTRNMWMYNTLHDLKIDSVHFIKAKANTIGDIGIVKAHFYWSGSYDEDRFADSTSFVDTWIKRYSGWQVVSRIITD
jgi:hypothetical protein